MYSLQHTDLRCEGCRRRCLRLFVPSSVATRPSWSRSFRPQRRRSHQAPKARESCESTCIELRPYSNTRSTRFVCGKKKKRLVLVLLAPQRPRAIGDDSGKGTALDFVVIRKWRKRREYGRERGDRSSRGGGGGGGGRRRRRRGRTRRAQKPPYCGVACFCACCCCCCTCAAICAAYRPCACACVSGLPRPCWP